ncbi:uncharacterized protein N7469_001968 [Penicillium citrinum]|uniref:Uncharacterized protein n=1 Tax=Penicillium citrinum TaxID=5077 RepID=A0A9W9P9M5_PENCI|nr:uncharacterized protein N7469_001968 [Penicillium citrinum]KAJ5240377.1 hypothetical protein N7469_001968 [Penicillium citrinum]
MAAGECGVLGSGMAVIKSPTFVQVINVDNDDNTASVSCAIEGTTYASCHAKETITVQGTLASKDLNWMQIPLTGTPLSLSTHSPSLAEASGIGSNDILPQAWVLLAAG